MKINRENKESDKKTYQEYLNFNYEQLFEEEKYKNKEFETGDNYIFTLTDNYNSSDILSFCVKLSDFKKKGNKFKQRKVNKQFKKIQMNCKKIEELTSNKMFIFENIDDNSGYVRIYNENKVLFELFKKDFVKFYKLIFNTI